MGRQEGEAGGDALGLLMLDDPVPDEALSELKRQSSLRDIKRIRYDAAAHELHCISQLRA